MGFHGTIEGFFGVLESGLLVVALVVILCCGAMSFGCGRKGKSRPQGRLLSCIDQAILVTHPSS